MIEWNQCLGAKKVKAIKQNLKTIQCNTLD